MEDLPYENDDNDDIRADIEEPMLFATSIPL